MAAATTPAHAREVPTSNEGQTSEGGEEGKKGEKDPLYTDVTHSVVKMKCFFDDQKEYITRKFILRIKSCPIDQAFYNE